MPPPMPMPPPPPAALTAFGLIGLVSATGCRGSRRALRKRQVGRDGSEIERLANEGAQRYDQFLGIHAPAAGKLVRGTRCQPDLFLGAEQDDVGQGGLNSIPDPACAIRARRISHTKIRWRR
jgi:hypothetical protein